MWSAQQQSMLKAMGYTLYVRPDSQPARVQAEVLSAPVASAGALSDSTLFKAVMKAVQGRDISQMAIDIDSLRSSPQAKRALWPQLRRIIKS